MRRWIVLMAAAVLLVGLPAAARSAQDPWSSDPGVTPRIGANTPLASAIRISQARFNADGAAHAVLSRLDVFADALAGTPLVADGPLLLTPSDRLHDAVRSEVDRVLPDGGRVYLLGGTAALAQAVEDELRDAGYDVKRLAGPDRLATAAATAAEVTARHPEAADVRLIARAFGTPNNPTAAWADSVTGGGFAAHARTPVLLSNSDQLSSAAREGISGASQVVLLGGTAALSKQVQSQAGEVVPQVDRAAGKDRADTAKKIATALWRRPTGAGRFTMINGFVNSGWAFGLPAAGLAADFQAPILPVAADVLPDATASATRNCADSKQVHTLVVGQSAVVSDQLLSQIEAQDVTRCFQVDSVTDGDTLDASTAGTVETIRLAQVNAPETNQCFGSEATQALRDMASPDTELFLRRPQAPFRDDFNRLLGEAIRTADGASINVELVRQGFAEWGEQFADEDPNLAARMRQAEQEAKAAGRGLWSACADGGQDDGGGGENCHPSYPTVCIPPPPPDLDCGDISHRNFKVDHSVSDPDPHNFDGNKDGVGCES